MERILSSPFAVKCGVRQGGVLFPILFSVCTYVVDLIELLRDSGDGCYVNSTFSIC